ncbi:MAG TPA: hypothetical protein VGF59_30025 [Bryobacteraceae bacterium]
MNCAKCHAEIDSREILREAARIHASRRTKRAGGRPPSLRRCPRCGTEHLGQRALFAHLLLCEAAALAPVTEADLRALAWKPDGAA